MLKPSRKIGGDVREVECRAIEINTNGIVSILIAFNFRYKSVRYCTVCDQILTASYNGKCSDALKCNALVSKLFILKFVKLNEYGQ